MIKCGQCGLVQKPGLRCERCNAVLERPDLAGPAAQPEPTPSAGLKRELLLDRRAEGRNPEAQVPPPPPRKLPIPPVPRPAASAPPLMPPLPRAAASVPAPRPAVDTTPPVAPPSPRLAGAPPSTVVFRASPAALWRRVGAGLVDALAIALVLAIYLKIAQALIRHPPPPTSETGLDFLVNRADAYQGVLKYGVLLGAMVGFVYSALFHAMGGRTPGKLLFGIRLVDRSGRPPTLTRCVVRAGVSLLSFALLLLGFIYAAFDRRRQALHDKLTATFVVRPLSPR